MLRERDSFVGRQEDLDNLARLVTGEARLLTVHGPGGVGKTRLAIRVAAILDQQQAFRHGVAFVNLREVTDPAWIPERIATDAGMPAVSDAADPITALQERLHDKDMLLVLDNCEHLADDIGDVAGALLDTCGQLRLLATSRRALEVPGESQYPVTPLSAPHPDSPFWQDSQRIPESMTLFEDRAKKVRPEFSIEDHRQVVARICYQLAGIPLLIEIVTARLRMYTPEDILRFLYKAFGTRWEVGSRWEVGRRGYRSSFRGTMELSWQLLSVPERAAFQRLSVFHGGLCLEAAEYVLADGDTIRREDVEPLLDALLLHSLAVVDDDHGSQQPRWKMLGPIQQVAAAHLEESGEQDEVRERHAAWCAEFVGRAAQQWCGPEEIAWLRAVHADLSNVRAALDWCETTGTAARGLQMMMNVFRCRVPFLDGTLREWRYHLQRMLRLYPDRDQLHVAGLAQLVLVAVCQGSADASGMLQELREAATPDDPMLVFAEGVFATYGHGADTNSVAITERARRLMTGHPDLARGDAGMATMFAAIAAATYGTPSEAERATQTYLDDAQDSGAPWHISWADWTAAMYALRSGDYQRARILLHRSLPAQRLFGDRWGPIWWVANAAWEAAGSGEYLRAAQLIGATDQLMHITGIDLTGMRGNGDLHRTSQQQARTALGDQAYHDAYSLGRTVDYPTAIALALGETTLAKQDNGGGTPLTPQELRVARLIAKGLSNDNIASELTVSIATVKTHVSKVLDKLGNLTGRNEVPAALQRAGLSDNQ